MFYLLSSREVQGIFYMCLSPFSLFYSTGLGVYVSSVVIQSSHSAARASVMYTVVTPMLNPFIYSLRNKDVKKAVERLLEGKL